jgi:translation initiation factor RLI1
VAPKFEGTVENLFIQKLGKIGESPVFKSEVTEPLEIDKLLKNEVQ